MHVRRYLDSLVFLERAESFLLHAEAENQVMLSIRGLPGTRPPVFGENCYLATVEDGCDVVACAVRTPPFGVLISRAQQPALRALVDDLAGKYRTLPAVLGPEPAVSAFARRWSDRVGAPVRLRMRQRLFEIRQVQPIATRPPGALRLADEADLPVLAQWAEAFHLEARVPAPIDPRRQMADKVVGRSVYLWDNRGMVSMAGWASRTRRGVRIGFVYTPPDHRGRGYASACVADLTQRLLDEGHAFCCISTDLANPTSNKIYQDIGYQAVCDVSDFDLNAPQT